MTLLQILTFALIVPVAAACVAFLANRLVTPLLSRSPDPDAGWRADHRLMYAFQALVFAFFTWDEWKEGHAYRSTGCALLGLTVTRLLIRQIRLRRRTPVDDAASGSPL